MSTTLSTIHRRIALLRAMSRRTREAGQATAEYALVVLGAAAIAALVIAWAAGTGRITTLLNAVVDAVIGRVA